jgi:hypothetical protein
MSQKNEISIEIPQAELDTINGLIGQIKTILSPYLHSLTAEEIEGMAKIGDKSVAFIQKVGEYTISNPEFVPELLMDVVEFNKDVKAQNQLTPVYKMLNQINRDLKDTLILCGSESFAPSLIYYNNVKAYSKQGYPNSKTIYEDLKKRFPGRKKKDNDSDPTS